MLQVDSAPRMGAATSRPGAWRPAPDDGTRCVSCGAGEAVTLGRGAPFCADCLAWTRQADLDELYDDLGTPG